MKDQVLHRGVGCISRRELLMRTGGLLGLAFSAPWNRRLAAQPRFSDNPFSLGVASGDPWPNSVVVVITNTCWVHRLNRLNRLNRLKKRSGS